VEALHRQQVRERAARVFSLCVDLNTHIPLCDEVLHSSLLSNTLHALTDRSRFLSELYRITQKKGKVLMVDWASSFNGAGPRNDMVVTPGEAVRLFKAHGFSVGNMLPAGTHHYAFIATKH
jgi:ubiquinone/menaquinone biosynthesis C-methylase UbiE